MMIPEPPRLNVARFQVGIPLRIPCLLFWKTVLATVQFHVVTRLGAVKIQRIISQSMLSPEFVGGKAPAAQNAPELFLRISGFLAQHAGNGGRTHCASIYSQGIRRVQAFVSVPTPHPGPLPVEGRGNRRRADIFESRIISSAVGPDWPWNTKLAGGCTTTFPPLTLALSPLRGEGIGGAPTEWRSRQYERHIALITGRRRGL
jgi:hypothetical protein